MLYSAARVAQRSERASLTDARTLTVSGQGLRALTAQLYTRSGLPFAFRFACQVMPAAWMRSPGRSRSAMYTDLIPMLRSMLTVEPA